MTLAYQIKIQTFKYKREIFKRFDDLGLAPSCWFSPCEHLLVCVHVLDYMRDLI